MKAYVYDRYGPPEVLQLREVEQPAPDDQQVLVRVHAVSLNPAEAHLRSLLLARLMFRSGLFRPRPTIPGADFAGTVEAAGRSVTQFRPGDAVFGRRSPGGLAEYVAVSEKPIALKPANATFEQAAAVPVAAVTALQALRDAGKLQPGQTVLVNGAAGGVGTFTVQIAKALGGRVTGVCSTRNVALVQSLGAERVIDYTREDFTRQAQRYDLIIDNVGNRSVADLARVLAPAGISVGVGFTSVSRMAQNALASAWLSRTRGTRFGSILAQLTREDLTVLKDMIEAGQVKPYVDRCYPFGQVPEAFRYLETKHAAGKIVVTLAEGTGARPNA
jgi:NADPH:quinone reductase-like Zn-dependent oxidoreductase